MKNYTRHIGLLAVACISQHAYSMDTALGTASSDSTPQSAKAFNVEIERLTQQKYELKKNRIVSQYPLIQKIGKKADFTPKEYVDFFKIVRSVSDMMLFCTQSNLTEPSLEQKGQMPTKTALPAWSAQAFRKGVNILFKGCKPVENKLHTTLTACATLSYAIDTLQQEPYKTYLEKNDPDYVAYLPILKDINFRQYRTLKDDVASGVGLKRDLLAEKEDFVIQYIVNFSKEPVVVKSLNKKQPESANNSTTTSVELKKKEEK